MQTPAFAIALALATPALALSEIPATPVSVSQPYIYTPIEADRSNATERIIDFHVDIRILSNVSAVITEYFTLYAAGIDIKRGIIRNIPECRIDKNGTKKKKSINIIRLKHNGELSEHHSETSYASGERELVIYFGSEDNMLEKGIHQYECRQ